MTVAFLVSGHGFGHAVRAAEVARALAASGARVVLRSDAPATAVQEMERLTRLHDDVMRVLTIKVDEHKEGPSVQMQKRDDRDRGERRERR